MGTKNLDKLWLKVPMADIIGLKGLPGLWIFGNPYK